MSVLRVLITTNTLTSRIEVANASGSDKGGHWPARSRLVTIRLPKLKQPSFELTGSAYQPGLSSPRFRICVELLA